MPRNPSNIEQLDALCQQLAEPACDATNGLPRIYPSHQLSFGMTAMFVGYQSPEDQLAKAASPPDQQDYLYHRMFNLSGIFALFGPGGEAYIGYDRTVRVAVVSRLALRGCFVRDFDPQEIEAFSSSPADKRAADSVCRGVLRPCGVKLLVQDLKRVAGQWDLK